MYARMNSYYSLISEVQRTQDDVLIHSVQSKLQFFSTFAKELRSKYTEIAQHITKQEYFTTILARLDRVLETISLHFQFLISILTEQQLEEHLKETVEEIYNVSHHSHINLVAKERALDNTLAKLFQHLEEITEGIFNKRGAMAEKFYQIEIIASKFEAFLEYFPGVISMDKNDLFVQPRTSEAWQKLLKDTEFKYYVDTKEISKSIKLFCGMMTCANAVIYQIEKAGKQRKSKVLAGLSGLYYMASEQKAKIQASLLQANPSMDSIFIVYNLPEKGIVKELYKLLLPSIESNQKIYLPRLFPQITKESVLNEYTTGTLNKITGKKFEIPDLAGQRDEIIKHIFTKDLSGNRIKVRILSPYPLNIQGGFFEKLKVKVGSLSGSKPKENFNGVIIHIHGGGFVSLSSSSHRNYLIRWAKSLNMVIFSIDYRLAPESPYPGPLDDVWQAYNWLVNYSHSILGVPMDRVVLAGDSAGGNLVLSLALRTIKERVRVPDGCLLAYPALNLYPKTFVPSYYKALDDVLLPYSMLKLCLKAYIPEDCDPKTDPFLSPIVASDELLSQLPAIRIITGTDDPLHDDNWKLLDRLQNLKRDVKMTVYEGVPHGFFSIDDLAAYELVVAESVGRIRELFYSVDKRK